MKTRYETQLKQFKEKLAVMRSNRGADDADVVSIVGKVERLYAGLKNGDDVIGAVIAKLSSKALRDLGENFDTESLREQRNPKYIGSLLAKAIYTDECDLLANKAEVIKQCATSLRGRSSAACSRVRTTHPVRCGDHWIGCGRVGVLRNS